MTDSSLFDEKLLEIKNTKQADFFKIEYNGEKIDFEMEDVLLPFGLEYDHNNNIYMAVEISDNEIFFFIKNLESAIENKVRDFLDNSKLVLKSQIRFSKYGNIIKTKVPKIGDKIRVNCYKDNKRISIFDIEDWVHADVIIHLEYIWIKENDIYYKWNLKKIALN